MPTTSPTPVAFGSLQYHSGTGGLVLLDSANHPSYLQYTLNTWVWNGTTWVLTASGFAANPTPRTEMGMASDGTNLIMFGGKGVPGTEYMNDTWSWNGTAWSNPIANYVSPGLSPTTDGLTIRVKPYMATMSSGVILWGGNDMHSMLQDTWLWTHSSQTWTLQSPTATPTVRTGAAFASNGTNNAVLFGGANSSFTLNDTWSWNGTTWAQLTTTVKPSVRTGAVMCWYPTGSYFLMFGGANPANGVLLNETWKFDGVSSWVQLFPSNSPSVRMGAMMAYDTSSSQMIMFGGKDSKNLLNDTWTWNGTTWIQL